MGKKRNFIPKQNTHDLLVGTLSIGIPSFNIIYFLYNPKYILHWVINNNFWINYHLAEGKNSKLRRVYPLITTYQQAILHAGLRIKWHTRFVLPQLSGTQLQTLLVAQSHTLLQTRLTTRFLPKKRKKAQHT